MKDDWSKILIGAEDYDAAIPFVPPVGVLAWKLRVRSAEICTVALRFADRIERRWVLFAGDKYIPTQEIIEANVRSVPPLRSSALPR